MADDSTAEEKTPERRSPTETLIHCIEEFGECEPQKAIVIWTDASGDICWSVSGPYHFTQVVGMLECVKGRVMRKFLED
jgi:hypothetical protein